MSSKRVAAAAAVIVILLLVGALLFYGAIPYRTSSPSAENLPPVAFIDTASDASAPGERVEFDGSKSKDPDGRIISHRWEFGDGGSAEGAKAGHAFARTGNYTIKLEVFDDDDASDSDSLILRVSETTPPPPPPGGCSVSPAIPAGLRATGKSASSVSLAWDIAGAGSGCTIKGYELYKDGAILTTTAGTGTNHLVSGLSPSTTYRFSAAARNEYGASSRSPDLQATTDPTTSCKSAPPAPTGLRSTAQTQSSISLAWDATPAGTGCTLISYRIHRDGAQVATVNGSSTSHTDTGLATNTTYRYSVSAVNEAGESSKSAGLAAKTAPGPPSGGKRIVGYFIAWGLYARNFHAKNVDTSGSAAKLTHINYAFANVQNSRCVVGDPWADYEKGYDAATSVDGVADQWNGTLKGNLNQLKKLKEKHPHLKLLISLGGWTWSGGFSEAAKPANRAAFVASCIDIFIKGNLPKSGDTGGPGSAAGLFEGIDIDWEYPAACGLQCGVPEDTPNFTGMIEEFRRQLDAVRPGLLLTIAAPGGEDKFSKIEIAKVHPHLDFINLMNYDYHGGWETTTNFHSPLHGSSTDPSQGIVKTYYTDYTVHGWMNGGVPASKLVLGLGFYGRGWANVPNQNDGLYQPSSTPAPGTYEAGFEDYKVLVGREPQFTKHRHPEARAHWIFNGNTFWSYDDPEAITEKMTYAQSLGLGGAMFWELSGDTANGELVEAIRSGLALAGDGRENGRGGRSVTAGAQEIMTDRDHDRASEIGLDVVAGRIARSQALPPVSSYREES